MDEVKLETIRIREDLVGEYDKTNKLIGYKAECFLKKLLLVNEESCIDFLQSKWNFSPYVKTLSSFYTKKYRNYLKDKEARGYIIDKYAEKQSIVEILCARIIDLSAIECIRLKKVYEETQNLYKIIEEIVKDYKSELRNLIPDDKS